jgi:acyl-CoA synthetase (AMP-forming)/AMP-acid ligase II
VRDVGESDVPDAQVLAFEAVTARWRGLGLRPGDVVLIALPNSIALLQHFFGVLLAGGVPVIVAPQTPSGRLQDLIRTFGVRALAAIHVPRTIAGLKEHTSIGRSQVGLLSENGRPAACAGEAILMTSGTSGLACGCVFGLDALFRNAERHAESIAQRPDDIVLVSLPLHFSYALVAQALATFARGGQLVISGPPFHVGAYIQALDAYRCTISSLTPSLARALLRNGAELPESLRVMTVGGDALSPPHVEALLTLRPGRELYLTYGLTQAGPRVSTLAAHQEPPRRHESVGLPLAETRVWLEPVGDGCGKQLFVSSDTVMLRRIGMAEGRAGNDLPAAGTLATGDLFDIDANGYLYFRGRLSDFVVRRGEKICLAAVRRIAGELPHVETVKTHVVTREHDDVDYFLTLVTSGEPRLGSEDYTLLLRKRLCRSELPNGLEIVRETRGRIGYK